MKKILIAVSLGIFGIIFFARAQSLTGIAGDGWLGKDACQNDQDCALVECVDCCGPMSLNVKYVGEWYSSGEDKKNHGILWDCAEPDMQEYHYEARCEHNFCQEIIVQNSWLFGLKSNLTLIFSGWLGYLLTAVILAILIFVILEVRSKIKK